MDWQKIFFWLRDKPAPSLDEKRLEMMVGRLLQRGRKIHLCGETHPFYITSIALILFFNRDYRLVVFYEFNIAMEHDPNEDADMGRYLTKFLLDYFNETTLSVSACPSEYHQESHLLWQQNQDTRLIKEWKGLTPITP
jgi:hypothetical protein